MSKKILLFAVLFFGYYLTAQEENTINRYDLLEQNLQTKILYNKVFPVAKATNLNLKNILPINYMQLYHELQRADFLNRWQPVEMLEEQANKGFAQNYIPLSVMFSEFESIKEDKILDKTLDLNADGKLVITNNSSDCFNLHSIAIAATLLPKHKGNTVKFYLPKELIFNTSSQKINSIEIDFADGNGFIQITENKIYTVNYPSLGEKEIKVKINISNKKPYFNTIKFIVDEGVMSENSNKNFKASQQAPATIGPITQITSSLTYQGYEETAPHAGVGEYQIFYDNEAGLLDKIIIVCDGFDPGDTRNTASIYNLLNYGNPVQNLGNTVRDLGYDVVVLNFPQYTRPDGVTVVDGGVDYIQRNARVLIELINHLNTIKVGNQEIVIIGPSMGGLISRYALRYMEINNLPHHTRLWLSFDSPHLGANVPIGMQHLFNYIGYGPAVGDLTVKAIVDSMLKSPAARQMLIDHFEGHLQTDGGANDLYEFNTSIVLPTGKPNYRNIFQNELNTIGFPQNCRKIAISNGAGNGTMTGSPGMTLLNWTYDQDFWTRAIMELKFTPTANNTVQVSRFRGQVWTLFWVTAYDSKANSKAPTYTNGLDSAPGGQFDLEGLGSAAAGNPTMEGFLNALTLKKFDFIPTQSSLAITSTNNWYANVNSSSTTPFDAYYVPNDNEFHVTLTPSNVTFALDEILNPQLKCPTITTWNGTSWTNGLPSKEKQVVFAGDYTSSSTLEMCSISVTGNAIVTFNTNNHLWVRGEIDVENTAKLIMNSGANIYQIEEVLNNGDVEVNRGTQLKRLDYAGWSSPVANQNLKLFSPNTLNTRFYEYNPAGGTTATAYVSLDPLTNNFTMAKGYMIRAANNLPTTAVPWNGKFTGTPYNGRINSNIENFGTNLGYNLIGNPYPSPLNIEEFITGNTNNIDGTLYFWTNTNAAVGGVYLENNFASKNLSGATAATNGTLIPDDYVQTSQGFFVNALGNNPIYFTNSMRNPTSNNQFINKAATNNNSEKHRFWLNLEEENQPQNQILIGYIENATNGLDNGYDGKLFNNGSSSLYSLINNEKMVIQAKALPFNNQDIVPLGFSTENAGMFTISLHNTDGLFSDNQDIFLNDKSLNVITNLKNNNYSFASSNGTFNNRFEIVYTNNTLSNTEIVDNSLIVYTNTNGIHIKHNQEIESISVYDTLGRVLLNKSNINQSEYSINNIADRNQVLFISILDVNNKTIIKKVVF